MQTKAAYILAPADLGERIAAALPYVLPGESEAARAKAIGATPPAMKQLRNGERVPGDPSRLAAVVGVATALLVYGPTAELIAELERRHGPPRHAVRGPGKRPTSEKTGGSLTRPHHVPATP